MADAWQRSVYSSMVESIGYDPETQEMTISWAKGGTSVYSDVPEHVANNAANAPSVGQFIHTQIKPNFPHRRGD